MQRVGTYVSDLVRKTHGVDTPTPEIQIQGHPDTAFPYILSHLEYIIGELLRNSLQATIFHHSGKSELPPIEVLICHAPKHVIFRVSDQGGGIPPHVVKDLWSFAKSTDSDPTARLRNFAQVPKMAGTLRELQDKAEQQKMEAATGVTSLHSLTYRPPDLKLGIGLPMARVYAEYWGGSLQQTTMEGYGTDMFLHIEKLGNRLEQLNIDQL